MLLLVGCVINIFLLPAATGQEVACPAGWTAYEPTDGGQNLCYYYYSDRYLNWEDGRELCQSVGADLPVLKHPKQKEFLTSLVGMMIWLGLNDRDTEGDWNWVDGSDFENDSRVIAWHYQHPWGIEPNGKTRENCAMIYKPEYPYLVDNKCYWNAKIICQKPAGNACSSNSKDIVILVDRSSSVKTEIDFQNEINYVKDLVREISQPSGTGRVAVVEYSENATLLHGFTDSQNTDDILAVVDTISWTGATTYLTNIYEVLIRAGEALASAEESSYTAAILFSDGHHTLGADDPVQAATALRNNGHEIFTVGIKGFSQANLNQLTGSSDNIFNIEETSDHLKQAMCSRISGGEAQPLLPSTNHGADCPDGWMYKNSDEGMFCYWDTNTTMNWNDAQAYCESKGARLPTLHHVYDAEITIQTPKNWGNTWAGISDVENEGTWKWTDGTTYSNTDGIKWQGGHPRPGTGCGEINHQIKLIDTPCTATKNVVCQMLLP